jgi:proprotein convertase subtilisin/kexin type 5
MVLNGNGSSCIACPFDCYTCNTNGHCLSCNATQDFRVISVNRCVPLPGHYESNTTVAGTCFEGCAICNSGSTCIVCSFLLARLGNDQCVGVCPPGMFAESGICTACPSNCSSCVSASNCTACNDPLKLVNNECVEQVGPCPPREFDYYGSCQTCPYDCLTCNPSGYCLSCSASTDFRELSGARCVPIAGYY